MELEKRLLKRLRYILRSRYLFKVICVIFILGDILFIKFYPFKSKYDINDRYFIGIVTKINLIDDKLTLEIKGQEKLLINYQLKEGQKLENLMYGDQVLVIGKLNYPEGNTIPNSFNYRQYLYHKRIYYIVDAQMIKKIRGNNNYLYTIKNILLKKISMMKSSSYMKTFILGDNRDLEPKIKEVYRGIGVSHLFSLSGMHINFISHIFYFYLDRITYNKKIKYIIINLFLLFFLLLVGPISSLLRAVLMYTLSVINKLFKLGIKKIDIMMFVLILSIVIDPFIIYDIGFLYSYLISLFLIIFSQKIQKKRGIKKLVYTTGISFFVALPITIYNSYEVNFIGLLANILLVPVVSIIFFPLVVITMVLPFLDPILYGLFNLLENIALIISNIEITKVIFAKPNIIALVIYYLIILVTAYNHKYIIILIFMLLFYKVIPYIDGRMRVVMFDVGQADSLLIKFPYNRGNILIDTGDDYSEYKIKNIISYLKSFGISKIDYLVITHGDDDHIGGAINLVENFKVENVIFNIGEYTGSELKLIEILKEKNQSYYQNVKSLSIGKDKLYFLYTKDYNDENENSSVIYTEVDNIKMLFMGDAGIEKEYDILEKYNLADIDILKVGHHGSNTSSSGYFIESINPKICLISVGANNKYGHPNESVLKRLGKCDTYRTDLNGSVEIRLNHNSYEVKTTSS